MALEVTGQEVRVILDGTGVADLTTHFDQQAQLGPLAPNGFSNVVYFKDVLVTPGKALEVSNGRSFTV